jgi:hypothetical protein
MEAYPEMIYGWCLPRILHSIVALRLASPSVAIFIAKYDYSDAYGRIAHSAGAVAQTITTLGNLAFLYLRLTFGGSPNPPTVRGVVSPSWLQIWPMKSACVGIGTRKRFTARISQSRPSPTYGPRSTVRPSPAHGVCYTAGHYRTSRRIY